jgi:hypothetical protein
LASALLDSDSLAVVAQTELTAQCEHDPARLAGSAFVRPRKTRYRARFVSRDRRNSTTVTQGTDCTMPAKRKPDPPKKAPSNALPARGAIAFMRDRGAGPLCGGDRGGIRRG